MRVEISKKPSRQEIEKVAKTIVIHVKENKDADPYDMIRSTGLGQNLLETLLKKFNIHNFLHDFEEATGDPHSRDVGVPPLTLDKLFGGTDGCGCVDDDGGTKVTKIEGPGVKGLHVKKKIVIPMSQAQDMQDMTKRPISEPPVKEIEETPEDAKVAAPVDPFERYDTYDLLDAADVLRQDIYFGSHRYRGDVMKLAAAIGIDSDFEEELVRCHGDSRVTYHIFQAAGREVPAQEKTAKWVIQDDPKVAALVEALEADLQQLAEQQDQLDALQRIIVERDGE